MGWLNVPRRWALGLWSGGLLLSAAADPLSLYRGNRLQREFERTASRLIEMQSTEYLTLPHRP